MNKVIMIGRLTKDPEVKKGKEKNFVTFSIAVNKKKDEANFFNCIAYGKTAEVISKYPKKGDKIAIEGSVNNDNYTDKEGIKHYSCNIIVFSVELIGRKSIKEIESEF